MLTSGDVAGAPLGICINCVHLFKMTGVGVGVPMWGDMV